MCWLHWLQSNNIAFERFNNDTKEKVTAIVYALNSLYIDETVQLYTEPSEW